MQVREATYRRRDLTLSLGDYSANGASMAWSGDGAKFTVTIRPLSDATVTALAGAAENHERICLLLPEPLLLDLVTVERKESQGVRIVGRLVDPSSMSDG